MLFNPGILLLCIHSSVLVAVAAFLAIKVFTERLLSSYIFSNTALHYPLTTALFGCNVACAFFHVWLLTNDVKWLLVLSVIVVWIVLARWSIAWLVLWFTGFGLEVFILFHIMDANTFNASGSSSYGNLEFWTSLLRLLLFAFIGICCSSCVQHIDDTSDLSQQATQLLEVDLEANYGAVSQSLPCQKKGLCSSRSIRFLAHIWQGLCSSRFIQFLAHIWPKSIGLQFIFHSRILLLLFQRGANLYLPYLTSVFLERIFQLKSDQKSTEVAVLQALRTYLVFRVLATCLDVLQKSLWSRIVQSCRRRLGRTALSCFLTQDKEWNQRHSTSEKSSAVGKARAVDKFITEAMFGILPTVVDLVLAVWFAANRFGIWCAIKVALTGLCLICFLLWSGSHTADLEKTRSASKDYTEDFRSDLTGSYQTIQILQKEAKAVADHDTVVCDGQDPENHLIDWSSMSEIIQEVIFSLGLYLLIQQAITGADNVKPVDLSALYALAIQLQKRLSTLGDGIRRTLRYWVVGCRIFDLIGERSTTADIPGAAELLSCQGNVKFQNVEFAYGTKPVLKSVSFDCRPGETTVFVGKSGAGKSTILDLVFRNYFAQNGSVLIDGQDIRNLKRKSLRCHIGVVPQNPILFNRTIMENLRFANEEITDEEIKDISRSLGFHDTFQELGYETNVGYSGSRLSGGQRMMVAITRIIVRGSKIILLDEATGPFDHLTEKIFHQAIDTMKSTKTVIMIAHRESTVRRADKVFWLRDGNLCGVGTHGKLIAENREYASFWERDSHQP